MPPKIPTLQASDWRRVMETGMQFTELRRSQARTIVSDLVAQGHLAREQMNSAVDEVLEMSRRRSDDLRKLVQHEVQRQLGAIGLATKADLVALERRVASAKAASAKKSTGPAKRATAAAKPKVEKAAPRTSSSKSVASKSVASKPASKPAAPKTARAGG
jgi:polyhydroxyalkanoate synthesis regulator phasin